MHPHGHCLVTGGGLGPDGSWRAVTKGYLLPVAVVRALFRGMYEDRGKIMIAVGVIFAILVLLTMLLHRTIAKPIEATIAVVAMIANFCVLSLAMKSLPLGTAYTIWTGIGAIGAFVLGVVVLGEAATPIRVGCAALILTGIIGLRLAA